MSDFFVESGCEVGPYPFPEYHAYSGHLSSTHIKCFAESPPLFTGRYIDKTIPFSESKALLIGAALHVAILEPATFHDRFVQRPEGIDLRTKVGKEQQANLELAAEGKQILPFEDYERVLGMAKSALKNRDFVRILNASETKFEQSIQFPCPYTNLNCKTQFDIISGKSIIDLKITSAFNRFHYEISNWKYDLQQAFYCTGAEQYTKKFPEFTFFALSTEPPYENQLFFLDRESCEQAEKTHRSLMEEFLFCWETKNFSSRHRGFKEVSIRRQEYHA